MNKRRRTIKRLMAQAWRTLDNALGYVTEVYLMHLDEGNPRSDWFEGLGKSIAFCQSLIEEWWRVEVSDNVEELARFR